MAAKAVLVAAFFSSLLAAPLSAHNLIRAETAPGTFGSAIPIADPGVSRVYYGQVDAASPRLWFRFQGKAGDRIYLSVGVPRISRLERLKPAAALVGPGLGPPGPGFELPPGTGARALSVAEQPREFHEEFTGTYSWIWVEETVSLPADGTYYFVAYAPEPLPAGAKLWMAIGTRESFSLADILGLFSVVRFVREYHEVKAGRAGTSPGRGR
jgi:hypothetical protein